MFGHDFFGLSYYGNDYWGEQTSGGGGGGRVGRLIWIDRLLNLTIID